MIKTLLILSAMLLAFTGTTLAQSGEYTTFQWEAPEGGSPVVEYVVELSKGGEAFTVVERVSEPLFKFFFDALTPYVVRVAGVDARGNQGLYSPESDTLFIDFGPPTAPGKPYKIR